MLHRRYVFLGHSTSYYHSGVNRHGFKIPDRRAHLFDARMLDVRQCDLDDDPQRGFDPWTRRYDSTTYAGVVNNILVCPWTYVELTLEAFAIHPRKTPGPCKVRT
ncbi:unnamed protein product [Fusarium graminearum]|nr:unnamed protein product [Fusarium graminearum]